MNKSKVKKILLITAGSAAVGLGTVGIVIPVLPTTPFMLIACFCFARSSSRLHHWLMRHRYFGAFIENYINNKAVTKKTKISVLVFLWVGLAVSAILVSKLFVGLILLAVGVGVTVHILLLKTI